MSEPVDVTRPDGEFRHDAAERRNISPLVFVFGVGGLVLAVLLVMVAVMSSLDPPKPPASTAVAEIKMPDGSVLAVEKVTAGPHNFAVEVQPEGFSPFSGSRTRNLTAHAANNRLVVWLSQREAGTGRAMDFSWWSYCVVVDEHGCEFRHENYQSRRYASSYRGSEVAAGPPFPSLGHGGYQRVIASAVLPPFRHSGKTFKLRFYDRTDTKVAELDVPNPRRTSFPEWKPEPLPITKSDGDVSVRLTDFRAKEHMGKVWQPGGTVDVKMIRIHPQFLVLQKGKPTGQWSSRGEELLDALGNQSSLRNCPAGREPLGHRVTKQKSLKN